MSEDLDPVAGSGDASPAIGRGPTLDLAERVRRLIWAGTHPDVAAELCGVDATTLRRWAVEARREARRRPEERDGRARAWAQWHATTGLQAHRHPLAGGLPSIFAPVLTRDEAAAVRTVEDVGAHREPAANRERLSDAAEVLGRPASELERIYRAAGAKLGASPDEASSHDWAHELVVRARQDDFITRLCDAFDEVLAPIVQILDGLPALFDPGLCPAEFLPWLARLMALERYGDWPAPALRKLLASAVGLYRSRGTRRALVTVLELYARGAGAPVSVTIEDPGGSWVGGAPQSLRAAHRRVKVRIEGARRSADDVQFRGGLDHIVALFVPVDVVTEIEVRAAS
jgi:phage tail-like protein